MLGLRFVANRLKAQAPCRFASSSPTPAPRTIHAFSYESIAPLFPTTRHLSSSSTLGEVWDAVYTTYPYRLVYPVLLWAGFLYYNLWVP
ncbi:hypothetical protein HK100_005394, partial [Physocladia obscura]